MNSPSISKTETLIGSAAGALFAAFESGSAIEPLTTIHPGLSVETAYAIQRRLVELHSERGRRPVGRKIGLTSNAIQEQLGVGSPDYGVVLDSHVLRSGASLSRSAALMIAPKIEAELAFVLGDRLQGPAVTSEQVTAVTRALVPIFELIDSRIADWRIRLEDTVADNAAYYGVVTGTQCTDVAAVSLQSTSVAIERDGEPVRTGESSAVMGDPAAAVAWLANELARFGESLPADELILSGSFTAAVDLEPGHYRAVFSAPFEPVEITIEP